MPTYIALLRGINVGGNLLKMERLREICSKMGFKNVRTYVQSGNVVFESDKTPTPQSIEKKLAGESRLPVSVVIRTPTEIKKIIAGSPYAKEKGIDHKRLAVAFLSGPASKDGLNKLGAIDFGPDRFHAASKDIYLHCPTGFAETKLTNNLLERMLGIRATTRNWNTVNKLYEMAIA